MIFIRCFCVMRFSLLPRAATTCANGASLPPGRVLEPNIIAHGDVGRLTGTCSAHGLHVGLGCSAAFGQILENALLSMLFESRALLLCLLSIKYVPNAFLMHSGGLMPSKHTPGNTSRNLVAEAKKYYEKCYAKTMIFHDFH